MTSGNTLDKMRTSKNLAITGNSMTLTSSKDAGGLSICTYKLQHGEIHTIRIKPIKIGDSFIGLGVCSAKRKNLDCGFGGDKNNRFAWGVYSNGYYNQNSTVKSNLEQEIFYEGDTIQCVANLKDYRLSYRVNDEDIIFKITDSEMKNHDLYFSISLPHNSEVKLL